jgi:hypothetical protein
MRLRFHQGVTLTAALLTLPAMGALFAVAALLYRPLLGLVFPINAQFVFTSPDEPAWHWALCTLVFTLPPVFGLALSAWRGARYGKQTETRTWARLTAIILTAAVVGAAAQILLLRAMLGDIEGSLMPMFSISSIDYWRWALYAPLLATAALAFAIRKRSGAV